MRVLIHNRWHEVSFRFWLLILFVLITVLTGGSSRADVQSLALLRPVALVICGFALLTITRDQLRQFKVPILFMCAVIAIPIFQLLPFSSLFSSHPLSWQIMSVLGLETGLSKSARPLTLSPEATLNAAFSLAIPFTVILLGCQLTRSERRLLLPVLLMIALFSGFWGLLQVTGGSQSSLYLYDLTNNGAAVGLFANRNHQATLLACTFPMLAAYATIGDGTADQLRAKGWAALAAAAFLVPLILVTGSRTGVVLSIVAIAFAAMIYRRPEPGVRSKRKIKSLWPMYAGIGLGVISLGALTFVMSRAQAIYRFTTRAPADELRFQIWGPIANFSSDYLPLGSGAGSFATTYKMYEPNGLLTGSHINQVHNDFIDLYLTAGIPGIVVVLLSITAIAQIGMRSFRGSRPEDSSRQLAKAGVAIAIILATASLTDYPLRVPSMSVLLSIGVLWLFEIPRVAKEKAGTT